MRPTLRLLDDDLITQIIAEARDLLCRLGVEIHNPSILSLLAEHGAQVEEIHSTARLTPDMIDRTLATVPRTFKLYALGRSGDSVGQHGSTLQREG